MASVYQPGTDDIGEAPTIIMTLPDELLILVLELCNIDSLLSLKMTNRRLHHLSQEILRRCINILDMQGLLFLPHQAGVDMTVAQLVSSLQITNQSWLEARHKRRVSKLREATGSGDTYVFDNMMMCCNQRSRIRKLEIFELQATEKDPVSVRIGGVLEIGHDFDMKKLYYGPINVECYDSGQDLLVFVHKQEQPGQPLYISLYSLRSLTPHPEAIEPVLCLPAHFIDGNLDAVFICGRSIGFVIQNQSEGDTVLVIRWKGASIFPAKFRLESPFEQILHMIFLDDDHPLVLTAPRSSIADQDYTDAFNYTPVKLRMLEVQEVLGNLSDALTLYTTSLLCQGPQFLFPPLKQNAAIDADMSWILPYHPSSPCTSKAVARRLKPSPYYDHAPHAGVFVIHLGGNLGGSANEEDDWQVQVTILKSEFLPWKDQPLTEVEWDTWGKDSTRIFQPRPDDSESAPDTLKACFMTWVESYRTASIAFDYREEKQIFHVMDFNPATIRQIKETESHPGTLVTEAWILPYDTSPFLVNVETCLPFYVVDFDLGDVGNAAANGEPCMIRLSSTGVLFERDDPETDEALVGYCWIDDGSDAYLDEQDGPENTLAPPDSDSSSSSSDSSDS